MPKRPKREITLAVPQAIDAANLIIIGQLALLYSNVLFQLGVAALGKVKVSLNPGGWLVMALVLLVPPIILVNILSGWISTRKTFEEFEEYPHSLFILDVLMIALFFMIINMVSFSVLPSGTSNYLSSLLFASSGTTTALPNVLVCPNSKPLESSIVQVLPPFIYGCCGLIIALYIPWNVYHRRERARISGSPSSNEKSSNEKMIIFNGFLFFALFLHGVLLILSVLFDSTAAQAACVVIWAAIWLWLNGQWLLKSPLSIASRL